MRKILVAAVLTVAISAVASSHTNDGLTKRSQSEKLIALSQEFVKTAIGAVEVEIGGVTITRSGPMSTAEVKEEWEAVVLNDTKVRIDGDRAVVTGQVIFGGQAPGDRTLRGSNSVTIHFLKEEEGWKLVKGCFGECGEQ